MSGHGGRSELDDLDVTTAAPPVGGAAGAGVAETDAAGARTAGAGAVGTDAAGAGAVGTDAVGAGVADAGVAGADAPEQWAGSAGADPTEPAPPGRQGGGLGPPGWPRWLTAVLVGVLAAALVALGGALAVVSDIGSAEPPDSGSVDVGFARDMSTHHQQAVQMAQVVRDRSTDPDLRLIAYDIETQQLGQVGQMRGWLESWGLTPQSTAPPMSWMGAHGEHEMAGMADMAGHDGRLMPGMATPAEMTRLRGLSGRALDTYFLQLMIRHHQGGRPMADYAEKNAEVGYVRNLAGKMKVSQDAEVVVMDQLLRARGAAPLPPP